MKKTSEIELKVGLFVTIGIALIMAAILILGGAESIFSSSNSYNIHFPTVEGLVNGAKVVVGGIQVGTVEKVNLDVQRKDINVTVNVMQKYDSWLRQDSRAEIHTQGVLGDKFISITFGSMDLPQLKEGSEIATTPGQNLDQFISRGDQLVKTLNSIASSLDRLLKTFEAKNRSENLFESLATTAKNLSSATSKMNEELDKIQLKSAVKNLNSILEKINNGTGTLGALVNDPGLYYDAKTFIGGANRNKIMRNLVRKTIKDAEQEDVKKKQ